LARLTEKERYFVSVAKGEEMTNSVSGYLCSNCLCFYKDEEGTKPETGNVAYYKGRILCKRCKNGSKK